jgi:hypothetical protein
MGRCEMAGGRLTRTLKATRHPQGETMHSQLLYIIAQQHAADLRAGQQRHISKR